MKVYRVEHKETKIGPYMGGIAKCNVTYEHPLPKDDIVGWTFNHYCAFSSLEQLLEWFDSQCELNRMKMNNYVVNVYEVNQVIFGKRQVAFLPSPKNLNPIETIPI